MVECVSSDEEVGKNSSRAGVSLFFSASNVQLKARPAARQVASLRFQSTAMPVSLQKESRKASDLPGAANSSGRPVQQQLDCPEPKR